MIPVPRGNRAATSFTITRRTFSGGLSFIAKNLPDGVSMIAPSAPSNFNSIPVIFSATSESPLDESLASFDLIHKKKITQPSPAVTNIRLISCTDHRTTKLIMKVPMMFCAIAVVEPVLYKIKLHKPSTPIVRGGSINLKVEVIRDANFTKNIVVKLLSKPLE